MKKKGFTLIELLAVIVILAIIALIATPLVLKYIEKSRIESFKVSVENIKDSAVKYVTGQQFNGKVTYPVTVNVNELDFKGKEDYTGKVIVYKDGSVEEYIEKDNYRLSNGIVVNGKNEPYLKVKEGKTAVIDEKNKLVYSFWYNESMQTSYSIDDLNKDVLSSIFEVDNGSIDFEMYDTGRETTFSTGAKIIAKDNKGNIYKEYQIVIFGDVNGDGLIATNDASAIISHLSNINVLTGANLKAADVTVNGEVTREDADIIYSWIVDLCNHDQINITCEEGYDDEEA